MGLGRDVYRQAAGAAQTRGDTGAALAYIERARVLGAQDPATDHRQLLNLLLAAMRLRQDNPQTAGPMVVTHHLLSQIEHDLNQAQVAGIGPGVCQVELARTELALGRLEAAAARARRVITPTTPPLLTADALSVLADAYRRLGENSAADTALADAAVALAEAGDTLEAAHGWYSLADQCERIGDTGREETALRNAVRAAGL